MKTHEGENLRNAYLTLQVHAKQRRLYFRDVKMYMKVTRGTHPPIPIYRSRSENHHDKSEGYLTEGECRK